MFRWKHPTLDSGLAPLSLEVLKFFVCCFSWSPEVGRPFRQEVDGSGADLGGNSPTKFEVPVEGTGKVLTVFGVPVGSRRFFHIFLVVSPGLVRARRFP